MLCCWMNAKPGKALARRSLAGVLWTTLGSGTQLVLQLATMAVLARLLAPADFGLVAATTLIFSFLALFSEILIAPALIQRAELEPRHVHTGFLTVVVVGFALSLLLNLCAPMVEQGLQIEGLEQTTPFMAIVMFFQVLAAVPDALAVRKLEFKTVALSEAAAYTFGYMAVALPLAYAGYGVWALIWGLVAKFGLRAALLLYIKRADLGLGFDRAALRDVMQFGTGYALMRFFNMSATQGDNVVVGRMLGAETLGLYDRAYMLMKIPAALFQRIAARVFFSALSKVQEDPEKLRGGFSRGVQLSALFGLTMSAALLTMAQELVLIILGNQWTTLIPVFAILATAAYPRLAYKAFLPLLNARGHVYLSAQLQAIYATLVIVGAALSAMWGLKAVAVTVSLAVTINTLLTAEFALRECEMSWRNFLHLHVAGALTGGLIFGAGWSVAFILPPAAPLWLSLGAKSAVMGLVALTVFASGSRLLLGQHGVWLRREIVGQVRRRFFRSRA